MKTKFLLLVLMVVSWSARAQDFSGVWVVTGDVDDNSVSPTCTLTQKNQSITGNCKIDGEHTVEAKGSVNDKEVTWSYSINYEGATYKLTFSGLIGTDKLMQGTILIDPSGASGEFTAKRQ